MQTLALVAMALLDEIICVAKKLAKQLQTSVSHATAAGRTSRLVPQSAICAALQASRNSAKNRVWFAFESSHCLPWPDDGIGLEHDYLFVLHQG